MRVLLAGESWITHSTHHKGVDSFSTTVYEEGAGALRQALESSGHAVTYIPGHLVPTRFPFSSSDLAEIDVVILSDIGANSLLLSPNTFERSERTGHRLEMLRDWVGEGGALIMIGGYLSFAGIDGKARYGRTAIEECLPVTIDSWDDRVETPNGIEARITNPQHPLAKAIDGAWPILLGYNRVTTRSEATLVATVGQDPLLATITYKKGRTAVFTSDCSPHWAPPAFVAWRHYATLWDNLIRWTGNDRSTPEF